MCDGSRIVSLPLRIEKNTLPCCSVTSAVSLPDGELTAIGTSALESAGMAAIKIAIAHRTM